MCGALCVNVPPVSHVAPPRPLRGSSKGFTGSKETTALGEPEHSSRGPAMFAATPKQLPSEPGPPQGPTSRRALNQHAAGPPVTPQACLPLRKHRAPRRNLQSSALSHGQPTLDLYQLFKQTPIQVTEECLRTQKDGHKKLGRKIKL